MASLETVEAAITDTEKVVKKQKLCSTKTSEVLEQMIEVISKNKSTHTLFNTFEQLLTLLYNLVQALEVAKSNIAANESSVETKPALNDLLQDLHRQLAVTINASARVAADTKDLHGAVSRLGKTLDKAFTTDICAAARQKELDRHALAGIIAEHLFHEGRFNVGEAFVKEAGIANADAIKAPYASMHTVLTELLPHRNLKPAIQWAQEHQTALWGPEGEPSDLEFSIHRLAFLQKLQREGPSAALAYSRKYFPLFQSTHMPDIQQLTCALCFAKKKFTGGSSGTMNKEGDIMSTDIWTLRGPYASLLDEQLWVDVARDFARQSCALLGQAQDSPLLVATAAGAAALPTLLKLANVSSSISADLGGDSNQLPVEVPLGREFVFHSIFACPVSKEQSTPTNPPMMLPCGHALCKASIRRIAKAENRVFKCPYCPAEATMNQCLEITFGDLSEKKASA